MSALLALLLRDMSQNQRRRYTLIVREYVDLRNEVLDLAATSTDGRLASPRSSINPRFMDVINDE
jgi:hypothetical protein